MVKTKWTEDSVIKVVQECREAGRVAAQARLTRLVESGPKWAVRDDLTGKIVGKLLDVCGFAHIKISARGKFFQLAKKLSQVPNNRFFCRNSYNGGGILSIFDVTTRQELSVNQAACQAMANVLKQYGIDSTVESRMD
jgi:hypothetical protein